MKFGILGYGNLGRAIASALLGTGDVVASDINVCDKSEDALSLAEREHFRVYATEDLCRFIADTDVICIVVKGLVFDELIKTIDKALFEGKQVVSFMAGVPIEKLRSLIGDVQLARAMPSLVIARNEGIIAYTNVSHEIAAIFGKFGFAFEIEPENMERVTAFASCGLGFAAYLIDAFAKAGEAMGFPPDTAALIAALTFRNACDTGNFRGTVKAVATPGGATEQGINHMDDSDVYGIIAKAMQKAYHKII